MAKSKKQTKKIAPVKSLNQLYCLAETSLDYEHLMREGSVNLGGPSYSAPLHEHRRWLDANAMETDERGVVNEINAIR